MKRMHGGRKEAGGVIGTLVALLFLAALIAGIYLARHPIMRFAAETWVIDEPVQHADAIVILSDDNYYADRATHATELYRHDVANVLIASGRKIRPTAGICELMEHDLVERGVPKEKIVRVPYDGTEMAAEADAVLRAAQEHHWKDLVLVTSNYDTRTARYIFEKRNKTGIGLHVSSAKDEDFDVDKWWEKASSVKLFAREVSGLVGAMWELREGSAAEQH